MLFFGVATTIAKNSLIGFNFTKKALGMDNDRLLENKVSSCGLFSFGIYASGEYVTFSKLFFFLWTFQIYPASTV